MWHNRANTGQRTLCKDCCRPRCTAKNCPTCPHCRNEDCTNAQCSEEIQALHPKMLPNTMCDVENYICSKCRHSLPLHPCDVCKKQKSPSEYTDSMWLHKSDATRKTLCKDCCRPRCTAKNCPTCPHCRNEDCTNAQCSEEIQALHPKMLPNTMCDVENYICSKCRHSLPLHPCDVCKKQKSPNEYTDSMWHNRSDTNRRTLCKDCCRPPCSAAHCRTCRTCRDEACKNTTKRSRCTASLEQLHPKQLPQTLSDVQEFLCSVTLLACEKTPMATDAGKRCQRKQKQNWPKLINNNIYADSVRIWTQQNKACHQSRKYERCPSSPVSTPLCPVLTGPFPTPKSPRHSFNRQFPDPNPQFLLLVPNPQSPAIRMLISTGAAQDPQSPVHCAQSSLAHSRLPHPHATAPNPQFRDPNPLVPGPAALCLGGCCAGSRGLVSGRRFQTNCAYGISSKVPEIGRRILSKSIGVTTSVTTPPGTPPPWL